MNQFRARHLTLSCGLIELLEFFSSVPGGNREFFHARDNRYTTNVVNYERSYFFPIPSTFILRTGDQPRLNKAT